MGTKKKGRAERSREDSRTKQNSGGESRKTRPDQQAPEARRAEAKRKKGQKNSHAGHGGGAPGVAE